MKISRISVFKTSYAPKGGPLKLSGGRIFSKFESAVVRIETDDGVVGWGEHGSAPHYLVSLHGGALAALEMLAPHLMGLDPRQIAVVRQVMDSVLQGHDYAKSAIDIACWDIAARSADVPLATLLGGIFQTEFPVVDMVRFDTPEAMRAQSDALFEEGFRVVQVKVGGDWREDIARIEAACENTDRFKAVIVDANAHWLQHEALQVAEATRDLRIMMEQPCRHLEQNLAVRRRCGHPFVLDESLDSLQAVYRAQASDAFDCAMLKLSRFGGITPLRMARDSCIAWGKAVTIEDMAGSDIIAAVSAHLAASTPAANLVAGSFTTTFIAGHIGTPVEHVKGVGHLPEGPGLGIEIDEKALGAAVMEFTA